MSEGTLRITNGKIVRPGFYREPGDVGRQYAKKVGSGELDSDCVFCPEGLEKRGIKIIERLGEKGMSLFVIQAEPAYAHFDAQKVVDHKLIIPEEHIDSEYDLSPAARRLRDEYIHDTETAAAEGTAVQSYTRSPRNPSKSIEHLHTHMFTLAYAPLSRFSYNMDDGVTEADFVEPTPEQIVAIERSRQ